MRTKLQNVTSRTSQHNSKLQVETDGKSLVGLIYADDSVTDHDARVVGNLSNVFW